MKYGLSVSAMGAGSSPARVADTAELAEDYGYDFVSYGDTPALLREVHSMLSVIGARTDRIGVGPLVTNPITRHPVVTASAICTLDELTDGRAFLGIATGDSGVFALGERPANLATVEGAITGIRALARGEEADLGDTPAETSSVGLQWIDGHDRPRRVPVWLAAEGPKTQELAGRVADGVLLGGGLTPDLLERQIQHVRRGARDVGRDLSEVDIWITARANVDSDRDRAVDDLKPNIASMANHSLRFTFEDKDVPDQYRDRLRELKAEYTPHHERTDEAGNVELLDRLGLTEFLTRRYAIVGEPADCAVTIRAIQGVDAVDGIYLTTPMDRTSAVLTGLAEDVFPSV